MLSNETVRKLHEMRLSVMAEAFSAQLEDAQFQAVSFEDCRLSPQRASGALIPGQSGPWTRAS